MTGGEPDYDNDLALVKKPLRLIRKHDYTSDDVELLWAAVADELAGNEPEQPWAVVPLPPP